MDHNKEVLRVKLNKQHFAQIKQDKTLNTEKNQILERGENPDFYIPRRQKMEEVNNLKEYVTHNVALFKIKVEHYLI
jgi:hypothetical protein